MKTKLINVIYRGQAVVDPRFSLPMLTWILQEIKSRGDFSKLSVGIDNGKLEFVNDDFEVQASPEIHIKHIIGIARLKKKQSGSKPKAQTDFLEIEGTENGLVFLLKHPHNPLLHIHLLENSSSEEMIELMEQMHSPSQSFKIPQSIYESQYIMDKHGIHSTPASNLKLSESMRLAHHDGSPSLAAGSKISTSKSYTNGLSQSATPTNLSLFNDIQPNTQFFEVFYVGKIKVSHKRVPFTFIDDALPKFKAYDAQKLKLKPSNNVVLTSSVENVSTDQNCSHEKLETISKEIEQQMSQANAVITTQNNVGSTKKEENIPSKVLLRGQSVMVLGNKEEIPIQRDRSASLGGNEGNRSAPLMVEQNRTMVFLIGGSDLRLISPDKKQILLYKHFKDVASCCQGHKNAEYFGLICRELQNDPGYIGYVFKTQSETITDDIITAISQAFNTCAEQKKKEANQVFSCDMCPMLWYSKLCADIEGLSDKKTQTIIFRRMENLSEEDQHDIMAKYFGATKADSLVYEQNQFLMLLLRAYSENKQIRHVHDTVENRSEFLNQYLGGSTIFKKAKRSLSNSFDHLLKRKTIQTKDDLVIRDSSSESSSFDNNSKKNENHLELPRSNSFGHYSTPAPLKSPMMDIFMKIGNNPKEKSHAGSWRQALLKGVVTPAKTLENIKEDEFMTPRLRGNRSKNQEKRTKEELRELWRIAIRQIIILKKMESENKKNVARQSKNYTKQIKLDYDEIVPCSWEAAEVWDAYLNERRSSIIKDQTFLLQAIINGVPRAKRGEIWMYLTKDQEADKTTIEESEYNVLLTNLTEHQHAIFIDLGRTFPNLSFYKGFGVGQLGLFNLLKAYSNLDADLGYCQGLGFICGVLLLHLEEEDAFYLLKHLMFVKNMRKNYLPENGMGEFQMTLYQFSRLLKDFIPDLYTHFDENEISPTLYAAPWFITVFSSQFPLGFVVRIFDLILLESSEVIFRVAIALLQYHKDKLLELKYENAFEKIMNYLKNEIPSLMNEAAAVQNILKMTLNLDFSSKLKEYEVEYHVLQEEISTQNYHLENMNKIKIENEHLKTQMQMAENSCHIQKSQIQVLRDEIDTLEKTVYTLGKFILQSTTNNSTVDLPDDIKKVVQQLKDSEQHQVHKKKSNPINSDRTLFRKSVSVNSHLSLALNVLEETNESNEALNKSSKKFFGNTFEHIRQNKVNWRLNGDEFEKKVDKACEIDSGITTPSEMPIDSHTAHPLIHLNNEVNDFVRFNGTTTQLKTIRNNRTTLPPNDSNLS